MDTVNAVAKPVLEAAVKPVEVREFLAFLRFAWPRMLMGAVIATVLAFMIVTQMPRTYTATAAIIYDPSTAPVLSAQQSRWLESSVEMSTRIESQVEVIKSASIAKAVIANLGLSGDPELIAPKSFLTKLLDSIVPVATSRDYGGSSTGSLEDADPSVPVFLRNLSARRVGLSAVVEVSFKALDPSKATRIANSVAETYINIDVDQKAAAARSGGAWLQERLEQMRMQTFNAMRDVELFKMQGGGEASAGEYPVRLAELESVAQTYRRMYESLLLQLTDTLQKVSYPVANARIVSMAAPTRVQTQPNISLALAFAATLGLAAGAAASLLQRALDRRIRSMDDLRCVDVPVFGQLSRYCVGLCGRRWRGQGSTEKRDQGPLRARRSIRVIGKQHQLQLSRIMASLDAVLGCNSKTIGISGLDAGSGATTLAILLAERYAATGHRSLLIDCRIDDPAASRELAPEAAGGLSELLIADERNYEPFIVQTSSGVAVLPAGGAVLTASSGEVLAWPRRQLKISNVSENYDVCLLDLPPLAQSADAQLLAPLIDAIVLVVACGEAQAPELESQIEVLSSADANLVGIVLNKTETA